MQTNSKRDHWRKTLADWKESGLSQRAWCDTHGLKIHQFLYWQRQLKNETQVASKKNRSSSQARHQTQTNASRFIPVEVATSSLPSSPGLSITLPNGICIQGLTETPLPHLQALVRSLS